MTILSFPNITPDTQDFGITYLTQVSSTSLTNIIQTIELPGARWHGQMTFRDLTSADSAALKAFLLQLRGASGRFYFGDLEFSGPQDTDLAGTVEIQTGSTARSLLIDGISAGTFTVGDRIQIGNETSTLREYKMVVDVVSTNELIIEPMMRRDDYVGKEIFYTNPTGIFMLDADDYAKWSLRSKAKLSDLSFGFVEAFT
jgi:hypothetical protein